MPRRLKPYRSRNSRRLPRRKFRDPEARLFPDSGAGVVGQRKLSITAGTYTHVLIDGRGVDYPTLLAVG